MSLTDDPTESPDGPPGSPPERTAAGLPVRSVAVGTLIALVIAIGAAVIVALNAAPADTPTIGSNLELTPAPQPDQAIVGEPVAVGFVTFDDSPANTGSYVGRPLVVNFFAEWCAPCVAEMPEFEQVYQEFGDDIAFLGLSLQETTDRGQAIVEQTGVTYDVGRDPDGTAFAFFDAIGMPTTVFIDATGSVVDIHTGALDADQLRSRIDAVLR